MKNTGIKRTRQIWSDMKQRCLNPRCRAWTRYGAKGLKIDASWMVFSQFLLDMGNPPTDHHTLDRINGAMGYSKENCRWATRKEQALNRSRTRMISFNGETLCINDWANKLEIGSKTLQYRLNQKWPLEMALCSEIIQPKDKKGRCSKRLT
jgi:hypothetical protein